MEANKETRRSPITDLFGHKDSDKSKESKFAQAFDQLTTYEEAAAIIKKSITAKDYNRSRFDRDFDALIDRAIAARRLCPPDHQGEFSKLLLTKGNYESEPDFKCFFILNLLVACSSVKEVNFLILSFMMKKLESIIELSPIEKRH